MFNQLCNMKTARLSIESKIMTIYSLELYIIIIIIIIIDICKIRHDTIMIN